MLRAGGHVDLVGVALLRRADLVVFCTATPASYEIGDLVE